MVSTFRSTGSYEPDLVYERLKWEEASFDPQALTSLTQAALLISVMLFAFRSTGSYEPDLEEYISSGAIEGFDPQALTSLT